MPRRDAPLWDTPCVKASKPSCHSDEKTPADLAVGPSRDDDPAGVRVVGDDLPSHDDDGAGHVLGGGVSANDDGKGDGGGAVDDRSDERAQSGRGAGAVRDEGSVEREATAAEGLSDRA